MIGLRIRALATNRYKISLVSAWFFWYFALYPARIGADYSALLMMIRKGESTDWWTGSFYWFFRITSINGRLPEITAAVQLTVFVASIIWFINSLPGSVKKKKLATVLFLCSPIFGFFGMTISHDLTQTAGIIFLCGIEIRLLRNIKIQRLILVYVVSIALVLTTHSGLLIGIAVLVRTLTMRRIQLSASIALTLMIFAFLANIGLTKGLDVYGNFLKTSWVKYWPSVNVLKCIAQHPEAEVSQREWEVLEDLAPKSYWQKPVSCSDYDITVVAIGHANIVENSSVLTSKEYLKTYVTVFSKNPAIGVMAHIQRARGVLPPILFQPPDNQVAWDVNIPIGFGTNTALQSGPELVHPSIDVLDEEDRKPKLFSVFEVPAQGLAFVFNQASWFWGWGGMWLFVFGFLLFLKLKEFNFGRTTIAIYPAILIHLAYLYFIPASLPRYYMFSICMGIMLSILFLVEPRYNKNNER